MKVESKGSRILGSGNRTKGSRDAKGKGTRSTRVADTKECKRYSEIPWTSKLLSTLH